MPVVMSERRDSDSSCPQLLSGSRRLLRKTSQRQTALMLIGVSGHLSITTTGFMHVCQSSRKASNDGPVRLQATTEDLVGRCAIRNSRRLVIHRYGSDALRMSWMVVMPRTFERIAGIHSELCTCFARFMKRQAGDDTRLNLHPAAIRR